MTVVSCTEGEPRLTVRRNSVSRERVIASVAGDHHERTFFVEATDGDPAA